jgi:hypothetical protein
MPRRLVCCCAVCLFASTTMGCLSLGGTTQHVHEDPDTKSRVKSLESRVSSLEAMLDGRSIPHASPSAGPLAQRQN